MRCVEISGLKELKVGLVLTEAGTQSARVAVLRAKLLLLLEIPFKVDKSMNSGQPDKKEALEKKND